MARPLAALVTAALAAAAVVATGFLARRVLVKRRFAAWDTEWSRNRPAMDWLAPTLQQPEIFSYNYDFKLVELEEMMGGGHGS